MVSPHLGGRWSCRFAVRGNGHHSRRGSRHTPAPPGVEALGNDLPACCPLWRRLPLLVVLDRWGKAGAGSLALHHPQSDGGRDRRRGSFSAMSRSAHRLASRCFRRQRAQVRRPASIRGLTPASSQIARCSSSGTTAPHSLHSRAEAAWQAAKITGPASSARRLTRAPARYARTQPEPTAHARASRSRAGAQDRRGVRRALRRSCGRRRRVRW